MIRYGAKTLPYGGWWSIPPVAGDGWMILGDSAGFLNSQRLKGIHLAIKSGMLAAETAFDAMLERQFLRGSAQSTIRERVDNSWIKDELWPVRNFHQGFENGFSPACSTPAFSSSPAAAACMSAYTNARRPPRMKHLDQLPADGGNRERTFIGTAKGDGKLTFDKLTDLYHSGTKHEEDQPAHLIIHDTDICNERCVTEFGNPCQNFCPANVYEMEEAPTAPKRERDPPESVQLRPLQDLRHHGSLRDHHLGSARGRRRPELRRHVDAGVDHVQCLFSSAVRFDEGILSQLFTCLCCSASSFSFK